MTLTPAQKNIRRMALRDSAISIRSAQDSRPWVNVDAAIYAKQAVTLMFRAHPELRACPLGKAGQ